MLPLSENMQVPDLIRKEKNCMLRLLRFTIRTSLLSLKIVKKEKEICANFVVPPQTTKVRATEHDTCFVKREKALNSYNKMLWERERDHIHKIFLIE